MEQVLANVLAEVTQRHRDRALVTLFHGSRQTFSVHGPQVSYKGGVRENKTISGSRGIFCPFRQSYSEPALSRRQHSLTDKGEGN